MLSHHLRNILIKVLEIGLVSVIKVSSHVEVFSSNSDEPLKIRLFRVLIKLIETPLGFRASESERLLMKRKVAKGTPLQNDLRTSCTKVSAKDEFFISMAKHYNCNL